MTDTPDPAGFFTWPDGTLRSMGPFAILYEAKRYPSPPPPPTKEERAKQMNRDAAKRTHLREKAKNARVHLHSLSSRVLRGDPETNFCAPNDADKTAKIQGRTNRARSQ